MVVGAIGKAKDNGALWFGTQASQTSLAPESVVANQIYDWTVVLNDIIAQMDQEVYGGTAYVITLENGGQVIEYNSGFDLPDDVKQLAEDTIEGIKDGSIAIPIGE
jgi:basic membrane protein A